MLSSWSESLQKNGSNVGNIYELSQKLWFTGSVILAAADDAASTSTADNIDLVNELVLQKMARREIILFAHYLIYDIIVYKNQGRLSLWDRGDMSPNIYEGGHPW